MNTRKTKCSAALEYPFLCWGGRDTTANDNCGRFRRRFRRSILKEEI